MPIGPLTQIAPIPLQGATGPTTTDDLIAQGDYPAALRRLLPRLQTGQLDPETLDRAAQCYWGLDDPDTALSLMQVLVQGAPNLVTGWTKLAAMAVSTGRNKLAHTAIKGAFACGPKSAGTLALLHRLEPIERHSGNARRLKHLAGAADTAPAEQAIAMNTLGRIEAQAGKYRAAFRWFEAANKAHGDPYRPCEVTSMIAAQILKFDPNRLPDPVPGLPRMLFVVGMPRSGTTLVESILARHPDVRVIGESRALGRTVMAMRQRTRHYRGPRSAWDWYTTLDDAQIAAFRKVFLSYLPLGAADDPRLLVTKMPLDVFDLGAARLLMPQARFLHMERHPLDVGLSNFITNFHEGNAFSRRLDWIAHMIRSVNRSIDDYTLKLGASLRRQHYETLVTSPETEIRALLDHAGLTWCAACLSPENGNRIVRTASLSQVQEKINQKGIGAWRNYAQQLSPLAEALGPDALAPWRATME